MKWKNFVSSYLDFTKKERTGIFILLAVIIACIVLPFTFPYFIHHKKYDPSQFEKEIAELKVIPQDSTDRYYSHQPRHYSNYSHSTYNNYNKQEDYSTQDAEEFEFDPNTATPAEWKRLGLRDKTIETISKYLSKGGHFYKPEDIGKIWGLKPEDIERLTPYVRIKEESKPVPDHENKTSTTSFKKTESGPVDINSADSTAWDALPGIGGKLSKRIITFRDKLGGFYSIEQVGETWGLPDSTFQKIKPKLILHNAEVKKLNINTATIDELKNHPYIRYNIANAIVQYRTQHGLFSTIDDLKKIMLITGEIYSKLLPYLMAH